MLHEASTAGRLGKTKEEAHTVWCEQVAELKMDANLRSWRDAAS